MRPFSAIPFAMESAFVPSYIPSNGTFGRISADEWKSYLPMPNYPEYPSATTAICYAHAEAMRRSLNSDDLKWAVDISKYQRSVHCGIKGFLPLLKKNYLFHNARLSGTYKIVIFWEF